MLVKSLKLFFVAYLMMSLCVINIFADEISLEESMEMLQKPSHLGSIKKSSLYFFNSFDVVK